MHLRKLCVIKCSLAVIFISALVMCNCYYESAVPLAPVNPELFDPELLGQWHQIDASELEIPLKLTIVQFRGSEYYIESLNEDADSTQAKLTRYAGYLTMVNKTIFMNIQELKTGNRLYSFFTFNRTQDGLLIVRSLKEKIAPQYEKSEDLYNFVKANLDVDTAFIQIATLEKTAN